MSIKLRILNEVIKSLEAKRAESEQSLKSAYEAMVDAPGPMQSHSDTTRFQKSILIESAGKSIAEKNQALSILAQIVDTLGGGKLDRIQAGAVIELTGLSDAGGFYVLVPFVGGFDVELEGISYTTITPASPIGSALLGRRAGEEFDFEVAGAVRRIRIEDVF